MKWQGQGSAPLSLRRNGAGYRQTDQGGRRSDADTIPVRRGEERVESEDEGLDFRDTLHSNPHLWSLHEGSDQKHRITNTRGLKRGFPWHGGWAWP